MSSGHLKNYSAQPSASIAQLYALIKLPLRLCKGVDKILNFLRQNRFATGLVNLGQIREHLPLILFFVLQSRSMNIGPVAVSCCLIAYARLIHCLFVFFFVNAWYSLKTHKAVAFLLISCCVWAYAKRVPGTNHSPRKSVFRRLGKIKTRLPQQR